MIGFFKFYTKVAGCNQTYISDKYKQFTIKGSF